MAKTQITIPDTQKFAVEIEHYYSDYEQRLSAENSLIELRMDDVRVVDVSGDSSVDSYGLEAKPTGPLNFTDLKRWVESVTEIIDDNQGMVNRSCGLHVHLDITPWRQDPEMMARIWMSFIAVEDILFAAQPASRRGNSYCRITTNRYNFLEMAGKEKRDKFLEPGVKPREKYDAISLCHSERLGSLEVRMGAGSTNPEKIMNWVTVLGQVLAYATHESFSWSKVRQLLADNVTKAKLLRMQAVMGTSYQDLNQMITERGGWEFNISWQLTLQRRRQVQEQIQNLRNQVNTSSVMIDEIEMARSILEKYKYSAPSKQLERRKLAEQKRLAKARERYTQIVSKNPEKTVTKANFINERGLF